jgi:hypothetical protein
MPRAYSAIVRSLENRPERWLVRAGHSSAPIGLDHASARACQGFDHEPAREQMARRAFGCFC